MYFLSETVTYNHVVDIMSAEWIRNTLISITFIVVFLLSARRLKPKQKTAFLNTMGVVLFLTCIYNPLHTYMSGNFSLAVDLPLHLCGISAFICSIIPFVKNKQGLFDFVFYTGIIGGVMGILTPQMSDYDGSFYVYFVYYIRHVFIFIIPIFMLQNFGIKPRKKSMVRTFLILNLLLVVLMPFNFYIGGNYMYLAEPPQVNNPLVIGEWPYYIFWFEVFVVLLLVLLYNLSKISFKKNVSPTV